MSGKPFLFVVIAALLSSCTHSFYKQKYTDFGHRKAHHEFTRTSGEHPFTSGTDSSWVWCVGPDTMREPETVVHNEPATTLAPAPSLAVKPVLPHDSATSVPVRKEQRVSTPSAHAPAGIFFGLGVLLIVLLVILAVILGLTASPVLGVILAGVGISALVILLKRAARPKQIYIPDSGGSNEELPENERKPAPEMTDRELAEKNIRALGVIATVLAVVVILISIFGSVFPGGLIAAAALLIMLLLHRVWINRLKRIVNPKRNPNEKRIRVLDLINWIAIGLTAVFIALSALI